MQTNMVNSKFIIYNYNTEECTEFFLKLDKPKK